MQSGSMMSHSLTTERHTFAAIDMHSSFVWGQALPETDCMGIPSCRASFYNPYLNVVIMCAHRRQASRQVLERQELDLRRQRGRATSDLRGGRRLGRESVWRRWWLHRGQQRLLQQRAQLIL